MIEEELYKELYENREKYEERWIELVELIYSCQEGYCFDEQNLNSSLSYIHPYRKDAVNTILNNVPDCVDMIIVYGSSITDYIRNDSDIDLMIISENREQVKKDFKNIEILNNIRLDIKVLPSFYNLLLQALGMFPTPRDIIKEGVPIYIKGHNIAWRLIE